MSTRKPDIYISGNRKTGKSTLAKYLEEYHGYRVLNFAGNVKRLAAKVIKGITQTDIPEDEILQSILNETYPKEASFTVKCGFHARIAGLPMPWKHRMSFKGTRGLMQAVGGGARQILGEDVWVSVLAEQIGDADSRPIVIDDCRYPNEATMLRCQGFKGVWINKPGSDGTHGSEWCQHYVSNDKIKYDLRIDYEDGETAATWNLGTFIKEHTER